MSFSELTDQLCLLVFAVVVVAHLFFLTLSSAVVQFLSLPRWCFYFKERVKLSTLCRAMVRENHSAGFYHFLRHTTSRWLVKPLPPSPLFICVWSLWAGDGARVSPRKWRHSASKHRHQDYLAIDGRGKYHRRATLHLRAQLAACAPDHRKMRINKNRDAFWAPTEYVSRF